MDLLSLLRTLGALGVVLGLLAGALWFVRRYGIRLPGGFVQGETGRVALVERTGIDARRAVALVRRDGREHLILLAPEGNMLIETAIIRDDIDAADAVRRADEAEARAAAAEAAAREAQERMRQMVLSARIRAGDVAAQLRPAAERAIGAMRSHESFARLVARVAERAPAAVHAVPPAVAPEPTPKPKRTRAPRRPVAQEQVVA